MGFGETPLQWLPQQRKLPDGGEFLFGLLQLISVLNVQPVFRTSVSG